MAIALRGSAITTQSKTSAGTIDFTIPSDHGWQVGDIVAVSLAWDYDAAVADVTMSQPTTGAITWSRQGWTSNTGGSSVALFFGQVTTAPSSSAVLTGYLWDSGPNVYSVAARAGVLQAFSGAATTYGDTFTLSSTSTGPYAQDSSGVLGQWLVAAAAWEGPSTDYSSMSGGTYVGHNGTTGSGATSNQSAGLGYDDTIPSGTTLNVQFTLSSSRDWAAAAGTLIPKDISVDLGSSLTISTPKSTNKEYWDLTYAGQYTGPVAASGSVAELNATTSLEINKPTGTASGDLLIAALWRDDTQIEEVTPPSGWTKFSTSPHALDIGSIDYFYKAAGGSEPATYTFTSSVSQDRMGLIVRITGADDTPSASGKANSSVAAIWEQSPALSVAQNDLLVVFDFAVLTTVRTQLSGPNLLLASNSLVWQGDAPSIHHFGVWSRPQTSASAEGRTSTGWPDSAIHGLVAIVVNKAAGSGTVSGSFTADAVIKKTGNTGSFLASAALKRTESGSVTAQSILKKVNTGSVTADAVIKKTIIASLVAEALLKRRESGTFTAESSVAYVGNPVWVSPASGGSISTTPTFTFTIPTAPGPQHFELLLDTADTFNTGSLRTVQSWVSQTGWEYHNGSTWTAVPVAGVANTYAGNNARHTVQTPLSTGTTWYWKLRAGIE